SSSSLRFFVVAPTALLRVVDGAHKEDQSVFVVAGRADERAVNPYRLLDGARHYDRSSGRRRRAFLRHLHHGLVLYLGNPRVWESHWSELTGKSERPLHPHLRERFIQGRLPAQFEARQDDALVVIRKPVHP